MNNYKCRRYVKSDQSNIFKLMNEILGEEKAEMNKKIWNWEFDDNPYNITESPYIFVLEKDNMIFGLMTGFHAYLKVNDTLLSTFWMGHFMIHPNNKGKGIFLFMSNLKHDPAIKEPYILLNTPNVNSYEIVKRLKWFDVCQPILMINILNYKKVLKVKLKKNILAYPSAVFLKTISTMFSLFYNFASKKIEQIALARIYEFDEQFDKLWQKVSQKYNIIMVRDRKYLTWRFTTLADREYYIYLAKKNDEILGYIIFRYKEVNGLLQGYIVDILTDPGDKTTAHCLIKKAVESLKEKKVDLINFLISPLIYKIYEDVLKKNGLIYKRYNYKFVGISIFCKDFDKYTHNSENWFMTMTDSDLDISI